MKSMSSTSSILMLNTTHGGVVVGVGSNFRFGNAMVSLGCNSRQMVRMGSANAFSCNVSYRYRTWISYVEYEGTNLIRTILAKSHERKDEARPRQRQ